MHDIPNYPKELGVEIRVPVENLRNIYAGLPILGV